MDTTTRSIHVAPRLFFSSPSDSSIEATHVYLNAVFALGVLNEIRLVFEASSAAWQQIQEQRLFQFSNDIYDPPLAMMFSKDAVFRVEIRLRKALLTKIGDPERDIYDSAARLLGGDAKNPLISTDSWLLVCVAQEHRGVTAGLRTIYATR